MSQLLIARQQLESLVETRYPFPFRLGEVPEMKNTHYCRSGLSASLSLLFLLGGLSTQAFAQSAESPLEENLNVSFNPPKSGAPENTAGGATRGGRCPQDAELAEPSLVPVVPVNHAGLTTAEHPSFLTYVGDTSADRLFFSLKSSEGALVYQSYVSLPSELGILNISLPENVTPLEIGSGYQWSVALVCGASLRPSDPTWSYQFERVELGSEEATMLANMSGIEQAAWYGQEGIWYDAASSLATVQISPDNFETAWQSLMLSVGLDSISTANLLQ